MSPNLYQEENTKKKYDKLALIFIFLYYFIFRF